MTSKTTGETAATTPETAAVGDVDHPDIDHAEDAENSVETPAPTYQVVERRMIQLTSPYPHAWNTGVFTGFEQTKRTLGSLDILPDWVSETELAHLLDMGLIELVA